MVSKGDIYTFIQEGHKFFIPQLSIDCVILGYHENQLRVLLTRWKGVEGWCLPGGYILRNESINSAASRILKERTGLDDVFLKQYHTFGDLERNLTFDSPLLKSYKFYNDILGTWLDNRTVSIGYYALVDFTRTIPVADEFSEECCWWNFEQLPLMLFDHEHMIGLAMETLRHQIKYEPLGMNLLPEQFTLPELQKLYETILGRSLDRRNFQKKIIGIGILKHLNVQRKIGPHRSPNLYSFDRENYNKALTEGKGFSL
ncbi:MAG TPA: NUDIX domain-containing protein [Bacteroidales bacterium]|nr:NUDIX domain-containing protein [Bacteroidales bacterium]